MIQTNRWLTGLVILAALLTLVSCSDDDPVTPTPEPTGSSLPFPDSPEQLMANFVAAYEAMDAEEIGYLLAPEFQLFLKDATVGDFPVLGPTLDRDEMAVFHDRMFAGESGRDALGNLTNPISSIELMEPVQLTDWGPTLSGDHLQGVPSALFEVFLYFLRAGDKTLQVQGQIRFFLSEQDSLHQGVVRPCFRLAGLADFTESTKADETVAYGSVLALFRPEYSTGGVVVQCRPSGMSAAWTLTGPEGYFAQGEGDAVIPDLDPGSYTISWEERDGWAGPGGRTGNLEADRALTFTGTYQERWPFPDSPAQLMANFRTAYETKDHALYRNLLDPDFLMFLKESTIFDFPELGSTLDAAEEFGIHEAMFAGSAGRDAYGNLTNPVSSISMGSLVQMTDWTVNPPTDPIPGGKSALFDLAIDFNRAGDKTLQVRGQARFTVVAADSLHLGTLRPHYRMLGQWDFTAEDLLKDAGGSSFGSVKALWR
ncbi:MAG: hypothetical protein AB7V45_04415 [Candidatus Krumholzibacteriia bacterium]